jgi:hypothetical protein
MKPAARGGPATEEALINLVNFTGSGGSTTKTWTEGDWDYDGDVDGNDVGRWAVNFTGSGD